MKKTLFAVLLLLAIAAAAVAHEGHKHNYLGTVKQLHENQLVVTTVEKEEVTFTLTDKTRLVRGAATAARSDLKPGVRVSVTVANDGRTATVIKIAK